MVDLKDDTEQIEKDDCLEQLEAYVGIEVQQGEEGASICVEIPISIELFFIIFALYYCNDKNINEDAT